MPGVRAPCLLSTKIGLCSCLLPRLQPRRFSWCTSRYDRDGDRAIVVLQQQDIAVDVVFTDVQMPGTMDGFGLARWVRKNRPELKVIMAGSPKGAAENAGDLCDDGPLLAKPYEPQALEDHIRQLLASRARN